MPQTNEQQGLPDGLAGDIIKKVRSSKLTFAWLALFSAIETTFLPIPMESVLIPLMLADRARIWLYALAALAGCVAGALIGYGIGWMAFETAGKFLIATLGLEQSMQDISERFRDNGFMAVFVIGVGPVPFQTAMLGAAVAGYSLVMFTLAATASRAIRYFGLGLIVKMGGKPAIRLWQHNRWLAGIAGLILIVAFWYGMQTLSDAL